MKEDREYQRTIGITRTPEFIKKGLATHAINMGLLCGHGCIYCSTPAQIRTHPVFKDLKISSFKAFENGDSVCDPWTAIRVKKQAHKLRPSDVVMLSTITDPYSPEAQQHNLARKCLTEVLQGSQAQVRILTKNAAIVNDIDLLAQYRDRVMVGLSITAPVDKEHLAKVLEPNASTISERLEAYERLKAAGLRTYGMLCPCMPGIASDPGDYEEMLESILKFDPEAIWTEPVNPRGPGLRLCAEALARASYSTRAFMVGQIMKRDAYHQYMCGFIDMATSVSRKLDCLSRLKILIYSDGDGLNVDGTAVIWLK